MNYHIGDDPLLKRIQVLEKENADFKTMLDRHLRLIDMLGKALDNLNTALLNTLRQ